MLRCPKSCRSPALEASIKLILPLLGQTAWADNEAALEVAPRNQLLDKETRHDGLAGTRIVRE